MYLFIQLVPSLDLEMHNIVERFHAIEELLQLHVIILLLIINVRIWPQRTAFISFQNIQTLRLRRLGHVNQFPQRHIIERLIHILAIAYSLLIDERERIALDVEVQRVLAFAVLKFILDITYRFVLENFAAFGN